MSTKITLYYNDRIHLYQECFDEENVYLSVEIQKHKTTLQISLQELIGFSKTVDLNSLQKQAEITDDQIKKYVENAVRLRGVTTCPFTQLHAMSIFGDESQSVEKQIDLGIAHYIKKRDELKKLFDSLKSIKTKFFFGLEELL